MAASSTRLSRPGPSQGSSSYQSEKNRPEPSRSCYCRVHKAVDGLLEQQKISSTPGITLNRNFTHSPVDKKLLAESLTVFEAIAAKISYPGKPGRFAHVCDNGDWSPIKSDSTKDPCRRLCFENTVEDAFITKVNISGFLDGRVNISIYARRLQDNSLSEYLTRLKIRDICMTDVYWSSDSPTRILLYHILTTYNTFPEEWKTLIHDIVTCIEWKEAAPIESASIL